MNDLNRSVFTFFNDIAGAHPALDAIFAFSSEGLGIVVGLVSIAYILFRNAQNDLTLKENALSVFMFVLPVFLALATSETLKVIISMPRPFLELDNVTVLTPHGGYDSLPSGHAIVYSALAMSSYYLARPLTPWLASAAILISVSRVIAGVHWPLDILVGGVIGVLTVIVYMALRKRFTGNVSEKSLKNTKPYV